VGKITIKSSIVSMIDFIAEVDSPAPKLNPEMVIDYDSQDCPERFHR
jgi:hypothetical protein